MNKASRKSGGIAWKIPPKSTEENIKLLNMFGFIFRTKKNLEVTEYTTSWDYENIGEIYNYSSLTTFLRSCPLDLAIDILSASPVLKKLERNQLIEMVADHKKEIFTQKYDYSGAFGYNICLDQYRSILNAYKLLKSSVEVLERDKSKIAEYFAKNDESESVSILINNKISIRDSLIVEYHKNGHLRLQRSNLINEIGTIEIDRVLICSRCQDFFWLGRKNMKSCSKCAEILRKKRWRDKVSEIDKASYNEARCKKRKKKTGQT